MTSRPSKRQAGASSSSAPKDDVKFLSKSLKKKFAENLKRGHLGTRWYDEITMQDLGLHQEIRKLCARIGAVSLLELDEPTYAALTAEFLTTFKLTIDDEELKTGRIQFQLGNEDRSLSLAQLNQIFGFPVGQGDDVVSDAELNNFWYEISGLGPPYVRALANMIVHPVFRVIQRLLGNTIFARQEPSKVLESEPLILFCMVNQRRVNLGYQLATKFQRDSKTSITVCIGGLITVIAKHFGVDLNQYAFTPSRSMDLNHLKNIMMIKHVRDQGNLLRIFQTNAYRNFDPSRIETERKDSWYRRWVQEQLPKRDDMMSEDEEGEEGDEEQEGEEEGDGEQEGEDEEEEDDESDGWRPSLEQQVANLSIRVDTFGSRQEARWAEEDRRRAEEDRRRVEEARLSAERERAWEEHFQFLRSQFPYPPPAPQ